MLNIAHPLTSLHGPWMVLMLAYVTLFWAGRRRQRMSDPPRDVPIDACRRELGLTRRHYWGDALPFIKSPNPLLDDYREAYGVVFHLTGPGVPEGWSPGWYLIPAEGLAIADARRILEHYPTTTVDPWIRPGTTPEKR